MDVQASQFEMAFLCSYLEESDYNPGVRLQSNVFDSTLASCLCTSTHKPVGFFVLFCFLVFFSS